MVSACSSIKAAKSHNILCDGDPRRGKCQLPQNTRRLVERHVYSLATDMPGGLFTPDLVEGLLGGIAVSQRSGKGQHGAEFDGAGQRQSAREATWRPARDRVAPLLELRGARVQAGTTCYSHSLVNIRGAGLGHDTELLVSRGVQDVDRLSALSCDVLVVDEQAGREADLLDLGVGRELDSDFGCGHGEASGGREGKSAEAPQNPL